MPGEENLSSQELRPFHHAPRGVAEKLERPGKVGRSEPMEAGFTGGLPRICRGPRSFGHAIPMHIPERHFSAGLLGSVGQKYRKTRRKSTEPVGRDPATGDQASSSRLGGPSPRRGSEALGVSRHGRRSGSRPGRLRSTWRHPTSWSGGRPRSPPCPSPRSRDCRLQVCG